MGSRKGNQPFDLVWKNIAFIDLREEFRESFSLVRKRKFEKHFAGQVIPIEAPTCTWYGSPEIFLSILLQRAVVGVESYLPTAVYFMALMNERTELLSHEGIRDPYALRGRGTADNYYNRLPSLYDPKFALQTFDVHLWEQTKQFYRDVRNPLFHGYELEVKREISARSALHLNT